MGHFPVLRSTDPTTSYTSLIQKSEILQNKKPFEYIPLDITSLRAALQSLFHAQHYWKYCNMKHK